MHSQILVIYPKDTELDDVMYPYQEIDKLENDKINDERCQFFLTVTEDEIPWVLTKIKEYIEESKNNYLEALQYRTKHSYEKTKEKYDFYAKDSLNNYIYWCDKLTQFEEIKDLSVDNPKQIYFIKEFGPWATEKWIDIYIKGVGYGTFYNPYQLWDGYTIVNDYRFPSDVYFLVNKDDNDVKSNQMFLSELDIEKTIQNINEFTRVWEHIIFCEKDPSKSTLYTIDDIRFSKKCNKHCLVDNLKDVLVELVDKAGDNDYLVTAIDTHW